MITMRQWLVRWLYAAAAGHVIAGIAMPLFGSAAVFDGYHLGVTSTFWGGPPPTQARDLQLWWIALFGPTIQLTGMWMAVLVHQADRLRSASIWRWLIAGLLLWAPQDMLISLRAQCWTHVWVDAAALALMLPPLLRLQRHDAAVAS